jgi:hypothetical protein
MPMRIEASSWAVLTLSILPRAMDSPLPDPAAQPPPPRKHVPRAERRLRAYLQPGEALLAWTHGWVSRDGRLTRVVAARTLDYLVVTNHRCFIFTTGFFTRRPRRCVYDTPLDRLAVTEREAKRGRHLRITSADHRPLLLDMRGSARGNAFAERLLAQTAREIATEPVEPE